MTKILTLNDIEIYREALRLAQLTFNLIKNPILYKEYFLIDQIKRAALSIAANIAEGYGRNTKKDFGQFLSIALGSVNELVTYLDFLALEYSIDSKSIKIEYETLRRRIYSFRRYLLTHNP